MHEEVATRWMSTETFNIVVRGEHALCRKRTGSKEVVALLHGERYFSPIAVWHTGSKIGVVTRSGGRCVLLGAQNDRDL